MTRWIKCPNPVCQSRCDEMKNPKHKGVFYCERCATYFSKKGWVDLGLNHHKWKGKNPFTWLEIHDDGCE